MRGFTLIEALISIATLVVIAGIGAPVYVSFSLRNDLDIAATTIASDYRRAAVLASASDGDTSWGVAIDAGAITLFKGTSYALRDPAYDETSDLAPSITPSGLTSVVFTKFTGMPQSTGTTVLTSTNSETRSVTINDHGTVSL